MQEYVSSVKTLLKVAEGRSLDQAMGAKDSPLSRQISYGVLRNFYSLSACLEQLMSKPLADKHQDLELLLLAGIYSIDELNRPPHASVNFAVEATKHLKKVWAKKLVNGVLRNYQRQAEDIQQKLRSDMEAKTNHPDWLRHLIEEAYPDHHESILAANQTPPPMTLRVNRQHLDREAYLAILAEKDLAATAGELCDSAIYLEKPMAAERLPGFEDGDISIQDEASQLVANVLAPAPAMAILDACAAPGGKTCGILEAEPESKLVAVEIDGKRAERIEQNLNRLKLQASVKIESLLDHQASNQYDRILLDVPCSATGIIRRHPDIKLLRLESDIAKLVATQEELLAKAWSLLNANGELVYSTCSILPAENSQVVAKFVAEHSDAELLPVTIPEGKQLSVSTPEGLQLLPTDRGADGFFFAKLKKVSP